jgi:hypothetical protein
MHQCIKIVVVIRISQYSTIGLLVVVLVVVLVVATSSEKETSVLDVLLTFWYLYWSLYLLGNASKPHSRVHLQRESSSFCIEHWQLR